MEMPEDRYRWFIDAYEIALKSGHPEEEIKKAVLHKLQAYSINFTELAKELSDRISFVVGSTVSIRVNFGDDGFLEIQAYPMQDEHADAVQKLIIHYGRDNPEEVYNHTLLPFCFTQEEIERYHPDWLTNKETSCTNTN